MFFKYEEFINKLNEWIKTGKDFYVDLLENIINNPNRYCGIFRLSNPQTKLIQNVTQSQEIKFGDFIEDITTEYIEKLGYINQNKLIGKDTDGNLLDADQVFIDKENIYLVEQKMRDDHDSTKKRGQYQNFEKKIMVLKNKYPLLHLNAIMWFVDDSLIKNKNYYLDEMKKTHYHNTELHLYYGDEFFKSLKNGLLAWNELIEYLKKNKKENSTKEFNIPDFGKSKEIYDALLSLPKKYWEKLLSNDNKYLIVRNELFSSGNNLEKAKNYLKFLNIIL